jgi:hypothetical protein
MVLCGLMKKKGEAPKMIISRAYVRGGGEFSRALAWLWTGSYSPGGSLKDVSIRQDVL